jgi:UDPglucose 6-dehydrogenase
MELTEAIIVDTISKPTKIAIVGTGYVGMACVIGFAEFGHRVVGYDIMTERVHQLQRGITPYREAGISEALARHLQGGSATFVEDLATAIDGANFIIVAVGTPSQEDGSADLSGIHDVVARLGTMDLAGKTVVLRSTVPPGTSEWVADRLRGKADVAYAPEFLREGSAVPDFLNPDRVVVGAETAVVAARYGGLFAHLNRPILTMSLRNAELAKGMSNAFLAMKISFANQVANLCDEIDADALDVLEAVGHDRRIGRLFLNPGIGFGGPCFEKDLKSLIHLSRNSNADYDLLHATLDVNDRQPRRVVDVLESELGGSMAGVRVGVWGLTFKGGTDDVRDSLAIRVVEDLASRGADIIAFDPAFQDKLHKLPCKLAASALDAAEADVLLVLTDWPQFRAVDPRALADRLTRRLIVDGRNVLDMDAITSAGLVYRGIGRRQSAAVIQLAQAG